MPEKPVEEQKAPARSEAPGTPAEVGKKIQEGTQAVAENVQQSVREEVGSARRPWYHTLMLSRRLLIIYGVLLVVFGLLAGWVYLNPVLPVDVAITREFQENQSAWLKDSMIAISFQGNAFWFSIGLIVLAGLLFWIAGLRLEGLTIVVSCTVSALINVLVKYIVHRPRPVSPLVDVITAANGKSFPSGHVMAYVAFWGILLSFGIILFRGNRWWRLLLLIWPTAMVVLVGPSRIYLGDHWASDVLEIGRAHV